MKLLLDTHALLWWLADDPRMGPQARALIEDAGTQVLVSVASFSEIVIKIRVGKLQANVAELQEAVFQNLTLLGIEAAHLIALTDLPMHHRDPFDHLLIAQAIVEQAEFLSEDRHARLYPVRVVSCSAISTVHPSAPPA